MQETRQDKPRAGEDFSGTVVVLLELRNPPTERQVTSVRVQELIEAERARLDGRFPPLRSLTRYWRVDVVEVGVRVEDAVARLRDADAAVIAVGGRPGLIPTPLTPATRDHRCRP